MDTDYVAHLMGILRRSDAVPAVVDACATGNGFDGRIGLRISSIFVIMAGSMIGALFPVLANRNPALGVPQWVFFFVKYFGSGVIIATSFIHLLAPANEALGDPCLTGAITQYPWAEAIAMMAVFSLFFVELLASSFATFSIAGHHHDHSHDHEAEPASDHKLSRTASRPRPSNIPGEDHLSHLGEHADIEDAAANVNLSTVASSPSDSHNPPLAIDLDDREPSAKSLAQENYASQMTSIFILEFGIVFHSIFIGLTLAVAGSEFDTLYVVLAFHQTFEGLGLGARLAVVPFPKARRWTPYIMAIGYGLATPTAIAIGLGIRNSYPPEGRTTLVVNGIFDAISAGILLYSGLVELMAHEFLYSETLRRGKRSKMFLAFLWMILGAALMALLGRWA